MNEKIKKYICKKCNILVSPDSYDLPSYGPNSRFMFAYTKMEDGSMCRSGKYIIHEVCNNGDLYPLHLSGKEYLNEIKEYLLFFIDDNHSNWVNHYVKNS